ncbi:MAG: hypothetical protein WCG99_01425 [Candidatus Berkelbacteria bacterium]
MPGIESGQGVYGSDVTREENKDWAAGKGAEANANANELAKGLGRENPIAPEGPTQDEERLDKVA